MSYKILILRGAQKELSGLPKTTYERAKDAIRRLADDPRPRGCRKLSGRDGWRIRIGDYRVIYEINDKNKSVTILHIGPRQDVYK
ncbi:MAG: type II toxin-antitoxin system RelE/ParE family toxin [Dehalococcoidales bacterium]|nr:type II toxin-antitoxin system RelE/ParE family toxin [Dehalococcoidales bacterium]